MKRYIEYEFLVRSLFDLVAQNKTDSEEAKIIRARLLVLDEFISNKNRDRVTTLAIKLYRKSKEGK